MRRTRWDPRIGTGATCLGIAALALAGCGGTDPDPEGFDELEVEDVAEPDPEGADASVDGDASGDVPAGDDGDPGEDPTDEPDEESATLACDLATTQGSTTLDDQAYERAVLEANFELELLAMELSADLEELLSGVSDDPILEAQLRDHRQRYLDITSGVGKLRAPDGADPWHQRAMGSFDAVCAAIADGLAGSAGGDDDRFDAFVDALTGFPSVLNQLHANAACGPFEAC